MKRYIKSSSEFSMIGKYVRSTNGLGEPVGDVVYVVDENSVDKDWYGNYSIRVLTQSGEEKSTRMFWVRTVTPTLEEVNIFKRLLGEPEVDSL